MTYKLNTSSTSGFVYGPGGGGFYQLAPLADNAVRCGDSGRRWASVWSANGTIQTSDERLKNHKPLKYGLEHLIKVNPIQYSWKDEKDDNEYYGVSAQEVKEIFPELVYEEGETLGVSYSELIPILINAVKELAKKVEK